MKKIVFSSFNLMPYISCDDDNLITNGFFKSGIDDWSMFEDSTQSIRWIDFDGKTTKGCLELLSYCNDNSLAFANTTQVAVRPIESYNLKAQIKLLQNSAVTLATIWIEWLNKHSQYEGVNSFYYNVLKIKDNDDWSAIDEEIIVPVGMFFAVVHIGITGKNDGSNNESLARFDDISLELTSPHIN